MATPPSTTDTDDAVPDEDPPEPQPFTDITPLAADPAYELHLTGVDGQSPSSGELRYGETTIAAVRLSASGRWFARLTADGLPADVTNLNGAPQEAAEKGAVMFAAFTGTPYGVPPGPAVDDGPLTRGDVLRGELRAAALEHLGPLGWSQWLRHRVDLEDGEADVAAAGGDSDDDRTETTVESAAELHEPDLYEGGPSGEPDDIVDVAQSAEPATSHPGDLPLWTGSEQNSGQAEGRPVDIVAEFETVKEAWEEHVPAEKGSGEDLFADVQADLVSLQRMLAEAVAEAKSAPEASPASPAQPVSAAESTPAAAPPSGEQEAATADRDPQKAAGAVNEALQQADEHASALQDLPEWQRLQTVRGAFGNLMSVLKQRAGEHFGGHKPVLTGSGGTTTAVRSSAGPCRAPMCCCGWEKRPSSTAVPEAAAVRRCRPRTERRT
ncbi:hypothetical protein EES45_36260 [Streptomyces sp. ADI97-07]|uniref:hypothetical protein n=1 Tax=Streptomyces sp. ADI97-07 TaxID=1522762 RepID=UPI000F5545D6|nr:hypothetical protein [Streptomyces sp. ADI97-07]RPK69976.1 hypothetical protein EES45_36260 [Streptomyces sp. ADI97-07]